MAAPSDIMTGKAGLVDRYRAHVVAASNVTLSGEQTIDGVVTSGSKVLCIGQSLTKTNGLYTTAAGAWSRDVALASDSDLEKWIKRGISVQIGKGGTSYGLGGYGGLLYRVRPGSTAATLGTDGLPWEVVPGDYPLYSNVLTSDAAQIDITDIPPIEGAALGMDVVGQVTNASEREGFSLYLGTGGTLDTSAASYQQLRVSFSSVGSVTADNYTSSPGIGVLGYAGEVEPGSMIAKLPAYSGTTYHKVTHAGMVYPHHTSTLLAYAADSRHLWKNAGAVDILRLVPDVTSFELGTTIRVWIEAR